MMDRVLALGRPVVYLSSPVVAWKVPTAYGASRARDEARLAASGLPYVILRPSAPYGPALRDHQPRHKESFASLVSLVRRFPLVPVPGNGQQRRQPIHCDDLSAAILALLRRPLDGNVYAAGGAQALSMDNIVETIARAAGTRARPLHIPVALLSSLARLRPELDAELLKASVEDELADPTALHAATGLAPRSFAEGVMDLLG
jgi:NADH dehydrogenase